ncbi:MAG TPA: uracil-DNA glycosylase [Candidatus Paceibacterota bacterium]|nr:uracil-DNA glycosylase [Candidatus Paceibacterota bacterium]HRZ34269.1 uracil-DNA glycosylase [Candidatus Paceibacterota bacterium]
MNKKENTKENRSQDPLKLEQMKKIRDEIFNLTSSPLYAERVASGNFPVIGEGSYDAGIIFIGEAPGKNEAKTGRPFCGASGKILDELLAHVGIDRKNVYVTNVVKDRPTNNRDPKPEEIELYSPFLDRQIEIIKPRAIVTLGRFSMQYIMNRFGLTSELQSISSIHGKKFFVKEKDLFIVPLYHPAVAVYNRNMLPDLKKDFEILKDILR